MFRCLVSSQTGAQQFHSSEALGASHRCGSLNSDCLAPPRRSFGKRIGLPPVKVSTLFTISQSVLEVAVTGGSKAKAQETLKNFLLGLTAAAPSVSPAFRGCVLTVEGVTAEL